MWQYAGQLASALPWYSNTWVIEIAGGPQPTFAQISLSVVGIPATALGGYAGSYINYYMKKDVSDPEPVFIDLYDLSSSEWTYVTMAMNPTMTSVAFTVSGSSDIAANVNVAVVPGWGMPVYPPYGITPP
jgi:hypothetical protein